MIDRSPLPLVRLLRLPTSVLLAGLALVAQPASAQEAVISGRLLTADGAPLAGVPVAAYELPLEQVAVGAVQLATWSDPTTSDGAFAVAVPSGRYAVSASPRPPFNPPHAHADLRSSAALDLELRARPGLPEFLPERPPRADRITVTSPDEERIATVEGAAGAAAGAAYVLVHNISTSHFAWAEVAGDGSFRLTLFAPLGSTLMVRADPTGIVLHRTLNNGPLGQAPAAAAAGILLTVPRPAEAGAGTSVYAAGLVGGELTPPAWTFAGRLERTRVPPGGAARLTGDLEVTSPLLAGAGTLTIDSLTFFLERLSGPDGAAVSARNLFSSALLTPTGLPIERMPAASGGGGFVGGPRPLQRLSPERAILSVDTPVELPAVFPAGYYRLGAQLSNADLPLDEEPDESMLFTDKLGYSDPTQARSIAVLRVGEPKPPRLSFVMLADTLSNGSRGVVALEDRSRFALAPRVLTASETLVVPRLDPLSNEPIRYRLEPFVPSATVGDRGVPAPPPGYSFRFPSGSLTVRVHRPDGSQSAIGPAPFVQWRMRSLLDREGKPLDHGGGHPTDYPQLSTMDPRFEVELEQEGLYTLEVEGEIDDIWGNTWRGGGTYPLYVGRVLALDTAVLPGTPFEVGDTLDPALHVSPPAPAEVEVRLRLAPGSDRISLRERVVRGRANRFGVFRPSEAFGLDQAGEYRIDVVAVHRDESGGVAAGSRTWGGVVAPTASPIIAHGRRGSDDPDKNEQWFLSGSEPDAHIFFPFHSGDVTWQVQSEAARVDVTFQDPQRLVANLLRDRPCSNCPADIVDQRLPLGELPAFSSRPDRLDPHIDPEEVDLWGYTYSSVQRPLVRVREMIGETAGLGSLYWRFQEQYFLQAGAGPAGDLPGDFKFQYGGVALYGTALAQPRYAIYGSLFVLVPDEGDPGGGTRTFPPFQGNGGGPSGGPILTLAGREIDLFLHPTGVRPGTVLEVGQLFSLAGAVGPPLPAKVSYRVISPSGLSRRFAGETSRIGWYYRPEDDFEVAEAGRWEVELEVLFDGQTSGGQVTEPFPRGDVLGTTDGSFFFYVIGRDSPPLEVLEAPEHALVDEWEPVEVVARLPDGWSAQTARATAAIPGFLVEEVELSPQGGQIVYTFDPSEKAAEFPMLDPGDAVTISLFASGQDETGAMRHRARVVTLHGLERFDPPQHARPCRSGEQTLCLGGGDRFEVRVEWTDFAGKSGHAHSVPVTGDTGAMWFFDRDNIELILKVLDGRALNGHYWVFYGSLSNVEYTLTVTDTWTGTQRLYENPAGQFASAGDTEAFSTGTALRSTAPSPASGLTSVDILAPRGRGRVAGSGDDGGPCTGSQTALCLADSRFRVEATFSDFQGNSGAGQTVPLTADTGGFWFFDPANIELILKVLDGRGLNDHYWVFYAALSNVEYEIRVTDTVSGAVRTYSNPAGRFASVGDTKAFAAEGASN